MNIALEHMAESQKKKKKVSKHSKKLSFRIEKQ